MQHSIRLFNTITRSKELFHPIAPPRVTFYNCGPTVYDVFHVGNARNFVFADTLRRWLAFRGYDVVFVQNLTDVDDKIIKRANEEGLSSDEVAQRNTELYFRYADRLGVRRATIHPKATEHIALMIAMIERLIARGHAYESDGDVFFSVQSYHEYGRLSRKNLEEMLEGERVDDQIRQRKRSAADFALWKAAKPGEPAWPSPWGHGRPGWHIECSAMSIHHLGETIDIHSGGADLAFPHHENEIAQSCCSTGREFVHTWVHNGFIVMAQEGNDAPTTDAPATVDNFSGEAARAKVSKSTMTEEQKSLFNIDKALARFGPVALRYFLVSAHYRSPLVFSVGHVQDAGRRAERLLRALEAARVVLAAASAHAPATAPAGSPQAKLLEQFADRMDDDLNTAQALAVVSEALTSINQARTAAERPDAPSEIHADLAIWVAVFQQMLDVLGLLDAAAQEQALAAAAADADTPAREALVNLLLEQRATARAAKVWALSDLLRDRLSALGIAVKDTPQGATWSLAAATALPPFDVLMGLLIEARTEARKAKAWTVADAIRDALTAQGIALEDGPSGTTWRHA